MPRDLTRIPDSWERVACVACGAARYTTPAERRSRGARLYRCTRCAGRRWRQAKRLRDLIDKGPTDMTAYSGELWFTGCTHFHHEKIIQHAHRPFANAAEMDAAMIERWNRRVADGATVFHLGDVVWGNDGEVLRRLRGRHVFIRGNHDRPEQLGVPMTPYAEIKAGGRRLVLCHYPIEEWNGWFKGAIHLHCHTHDQSPVTAPRRVNVTVEAHDYAPVSLREVLVLAGVGMAERD